VERWSPKGMTRASPVALYTEIKVEPMMLDGPGTNEVYGQQRESTLVPLADIPRRAFIDALPVVGALAASTTFFDGFATGSITDVTDLDWIAVPRHLCKPKRFVIRVAGDSMEPLFKVGDLLVFDYHRTPRIDGQIVIAADFTSGSGEYAVKRYKEDLMRWRFISENPAYAPVEIEKSEMPFPILGTFVAKLESSCTL